MVEWNGEWNSGTCFEVTAQAVSMKVTIEVLLLIIYPRY